METTVLVVEVVARLAAAPVEVHTTNISSSTNAKGGNRSSSSSSRSSGRRNGSNSSTCSCGCTGLEGRQTVLLNHRCLRQLQRAPTTASDRPHTYHSQHAGHSTFERLDSLGFAMDMGIDSTRLKISSTRVWCNGLVSQALIRWAEWGSHDALGRTTPKTRPPVPSQCTIMRACKNQRQFPGIPRKHTRV